MLFLLLLVSAILVIPGCECLWNGGHRSVLKGSLFGIWLPIMICLQKEGWPTTWATWIGIGAGIIIIASGQWLIWKGSRAAGRNRKGGWAMTLAGIIILLTVAFS